MLRVGGFLPIAAASLAALALVVVAAGFALAFATRRQAAVMRWWRGLVLVLGFAGILIGVVGVVVGLANLLRAAASTDPADLRLMVQAISQMSICPAAGLVAALVAFAGYFSAWKITNRD